MLQSAIIKPRARSKSMCVFVERDERHNNGVERLGVDTFVDPRDRFENAERVGLKMPGFAAPAGENQTAVTVDLRQVNVASCGEQ